MQLGRLYQAAPELRVRTWIDGSGEPMDTPLRLDDLGFGYKSSLLSSIGVRGAIERVSHAAALLPHAQGRWRFRLSRNPDGFRGRGRNTLDKLRINQERCGLSIPFGHDVPFDGDRHPSFMEDYGNAGTPWFTVIDPSRQVVFADFRLDADRFLVALDARYLDIDAA